MLKLIIVDDEKVIRETIHSIINWEKIGINVAAICKDGIEAYDAILDDYPDIVLTDIKMPGLSGLEMIQKVKQAELNVEFVILSGYGEFELAQTAMKYGVKHFLLKPCNEREIIQVLHACITDCQNNMVQRIDALINELFQGEEERAKDMQQKIFNLLSSQKDVSLARVQIVKIMMCAVKDKVGQLNNMEMAEYIMSLNSCEEIDLILEFAEQIMSKIFTPMPQHKYIDCVEKIVEYVSDHLSDCNLSLKWLAENYLYMNADYVSKQFVKETGSKFSAYLTSLRIQEAKKLLLLNEYDSPYSVAEQVGFGNNPQYFSQIFKKYTQMTPSAYVKKMV